MKTLLLLRIAAGFISALVPLVGTGAVSIHVNANAGIPGDGSAGKPFKTIAEGLASAKTQPAGDEVIVEIAPGNYVENVPLVCDRNQLKLRGATRLSLDADRLPAASGHIKETVVCPASLPLTGAPVFFVGKDGSRLAAVTFERLIIDGQSKNTGSGAAFANAGIDAANVEQLRMSNVLVRNTAIGICTRFAEGLIDTCRTEQNDFGFMVQGGWPASKINMHDCIAVSAAPREGIFGFVFFSTAETGDMKLGAPRPLPMGTLVGGNPAAEELELHLKNCAGESFSARASNCAGFNFAPFGRFGPPLLANATTIAHVENCTARKNRHAVRIAVNQQLPDNTNLKKLRLTLVNDRLSPAAGVDANAFSGYANGNCNQNVSVEIHESNLPTGFDSLLTGFSYDAATGNQRGGSWGQNSNFTFDAPPPVPSVNIQGTECPPN